ncbi:hypothetical protein D3C71_1147940 [compost metagenome]
MVRKSLLELADSTRRSTPTASDTAPAGRLNKSPVTLALKTFRSFSLVLWMVGLISSNAASCAWPVGVFGSGAGPRKLTGIQSLIAVAALPGVRTQIGLPVAGSIIDGPSASVRPWPIR